LQNLALLPFWVSGVPATVLFTSGSTFGGLPLKRQFQGGKCQWPSL
jgi:hypothetical protein